MLVQGFFSVLWWGQMALTLFALFAFVDAAVRREDAYRAADKRTKVFWLIILGLSAFFIYFMNYTWFIAVFGVVAVIVYMVDVRPAIRAITGSGGGRNRNRNRRGSSSDGPYGPFNG
jgi:Protein of unknown function (DUF2516)